MARSELEQALSAAERLPTDFGHAVRAVRLLLSAREDARATAVARRFVGAHELPVQAASDLLLLIRRASRRRVQGGQPLLEEGQGGRSLFVITQGRARVERMGVGGLGTLEAGAVVGEIAPLSGVARTASVTALVPVEALVFDEDAQGILRAELPAVYAHLEATGRARLAMQMMGPDSIFAELTDEQRAALYAECTPCTLPEGTRLIREGHESNAVCIIASGHAEVWRRAEGGGRETLATLGPGEVFGELALLYGRCATATVEAVTPLTVFALEQRGFRGALTRFQGAEDRVRALAAARLAEHNLRDLGTPLPVVSVVRVG